MELTDLERLILAQLSDKADNEHGYNRIAIDGYSIDELNAANEKLIGHAWRTAFLCRSHSVLGWLRLDCRR